MSACFALGLHAGTPINLIFCAWQEAWKGFMQDLGNFPDRYITAVSHDVY